MKRTLCPHCKGKLEPGQRIHPYCIDAWSKEQEAKAKRTEEKRVRLEAKLHRAALKKSRLVNRTLTDWKAIAQKETNALVLLRDKDLPCISCGRFHSEVWHAGHYRSRGSAPHLALDLRNIHKQCPQCNMHLHGNLIEYRKGLVKKMGESFVMELECDQASRKYTKHDMEVIAQKRRQQKKELERERQ